jgi:hypothetical protein
MKIGNRSIWNLSNRIPEIYGVLIALGLIVYFFAMYLLGLIHVVELRLLNLVVLAAGVYFAMKQYSRTHGFHMDYFHAFTTGIGAAAIGTAIFSVFLFLYLQLDHSLMRSIARREPLGLYLNPYIAAFMVSLEGLFSGIFVTFLLSNFMAERRHVNRPRETEVIQ